MQELKDSKKDPPSDVEILEENFCQKTPSLHLVEKSTASVSIQPSSSSSPGNNNQLFNASSLLEKTISTPNGKPQALPNLVANYTSESDDEDSGMETRNFEEEESSPMPSSLTQEKRITDIQQSPSLTPERNSSTSSGSKNEEEEVYTVPKNTAVESEVQ